MFDFGKVHVGIASIVFSSLLQAFQMVLSRLVKDLGWPFWRFVIGSTILTALTFGFVALITGANFPDAPQRKWVIMRAVFSTCSFASALLAVQIDGAPGDVTALTSINIVFAAFMGHLFLAEKMRPVHFVIMLGSILGAILISQPSFIFRGEAGSWLTYVLALFSGFARAASFVCTRKTRNVSTSVIACATSTFGLPVIVLLLFAPTVAEPPLGRELTEPLVAGGLLLALFFLSLMAISSAAMGAAFCPAAVSATVFTGTGMIFGYLAQTLVFHATPGLLKVIGATLMLCSVMATAAARAPQQHASAVPPSPSAESTSSSTEVIPNVTSVDDDETESLASFVASEFSTKSPHEPPLRWRGQTSKPAPERIGATDLAAVIAVAAV